MATQFFPTTDLSPQFLNVSWADIVEAEESEDLEAIERLRCSSTSLSSLSDKENQEKALVTSCSSSRVPLVAHPMENCSPKDVIALKKPPVKRHRPKSYADIVQSSRAKRTNSSRPNTPTSTPPLSSPSPDLSCEMSDDCTPEANEKCEGSDAVTAQRRLSFTVQRSLSSNSDGGGEVVLSGHQLQVRQKQLDYGKNTPGYQRYVTLIPKWKRRKQHPKTPNKHQICSRRSWDGQIKKWRRLLHAFDPPTAEDADNDTLTTDDLKTAPVDLDETSNMDSEQLQ
ncbi:histone RNA hairpin-binding protein-like [Dysidea avara]|uniref:histone RNA hairpin-binding protein-like n=1 Tax=Dysidea avara TaxID=196820 RepID=UPI00332F9D3A